jgi:hypothetical protein
VQRKIFRSKNNGVSGQFREFCDFYRSPVIVRVMRSSEYVGWPCSKDNRRNAYRILVGNILLNVHLGQREADGRVALRWILERQVVRIRC